jgi:hypothetical protein
VWCPGQNKIITALPFFDGCRKRRLKGLIALTPENEIDYDQTVMDLPPVTSVVFLIAK